MATIRPWNFGGILSETTTTTKMNKRSSHCTATSSEKYILSLDITLKLKKMDKQNVTNSFITFYHVRHDICTLSIIRFWNYKLIYLPRKPDKSANIIDTVSEMFAFGKIF